MGVWLGERGERKWGGGMEEKGKGRMQEEVGKRKGTRRGEWGIDEGGGEEKEGGSGGREERKS